MLAVKRLCFDRVRGPIITTAVLSLLMVLSGHLGTVYGQGFDIKYNFGLERGDYKDFDLAQPVWELCRDQCAAESACLSFTYTIPIAGANGRPAHCWLKNIVPRGEGRDWCISGIKKIDAGCGNDYFLQAPATAATGTKIKVNFGFRGPRPTSQTDWIAFLRAGKNEYVGWYWVKDLTGCEAIFDAPAPGNYEIKYLLEGGYDKAVAVAPITIQ